MLASGIARGGSAGVTAVAGVVLAGGLGTRMAPDSKPSVVLGGRPLIAGPLAALAETCSSVAVACKRGTLLPVLPAGVERWEEPDEPRHPLTGIVYALERADGPVLVCAADMPFVDVATCAALIAAHERAGCTVLAQAEGRLQPVLGIYAPEALVALRGAAPGAPLTATVAALSPQTLELSAAVCVSIDTPAALAAARATLSA